MFYVTRAITINRIDTVARGTTPSVTYNLLYSPTRSGTAGSVFAANQIMNSTTGSTYNSFTNASIGAGSWVWFITSAQSGTVTESHFTIEYKEV